MAHLKTKLTTPDGVEHPEAIGILSDAQIISVGKTWADGPADHHRAVPRHLR